MCAHVCVCNAVRFQVSHELVSAWLLGDNVSSSVSSSALPLPSSPWECKRSCLLEGEQGMNVGEVSSRAEVLPATLQYEVVCYCKCEIALLRISVKFDCLLCALYTLKLLSISIVWRNMGKKCLE